MTTSPSFRTDINALRALAVGIVVLFHFKFPGFKGGFLGVDIFFVISGYLMTKLIAGDMLKARFRYLPFVAMRIARIWPALVGLVLVLLLLGAAFLAPTDYQELGRQIRPAVLFYSNDFYSQGLGYFSAGPDERWLLHTWSLSVEWQFYLVYPLLLMAVQAAQRRLRPAANGQALTQTFLVTLAIVAICSFAWSVWATRVDQVSAFFSLFTRIWEMLCGGLVYLTESRLKAVRPSTRNRVLAFSFAGLAATVAAAGMGDWEAKWPGAWSAFPVLFTTLALAFGSGSTGLFRRLIDNGLVQRLGLWSYSIYLWHWPFVVAMNFSELHPPLAPYLKYLKIGGVLASVALGYLSYVLIEQRIRYRKEGSVRQRSVIAPVGGVALAMGLALAVVQTEGWLSRTGAEQPLYRELAALKSTPIFPRTCGNPKTPKQQLASCSIDPRDANAPRTLVYGDSHAQHLYSWFKGNSAGPVEFFTSSGCPPIAGYNRKEQGYFCDQYMEEVIRRAHLPEYATVVVAGNWSGLPSLCRSDAGHCVPDPGSRAEKAEIMADINRAFWRELVQSGKKVIVVDQSPMSRIDILKTSIRRHYLDLAPIATFTDIVAGKSGSKSHLDDVFELLSHSERLIRVSLRSEFCVEADCKVFDGQSGLPIMVDRSHFAPWWIKTHGHSLQKVLRSPLTVAATSPQIP